MSIHDRVRQPPPTSVSGWVKWHQEHGLDVIDCVGIDPLYANFNAFEQAWFDSGCRDEIPMGVFAGMSPQQARKTYNEFLKQFHFDYLWVANQAPIFELSDSLTANLMLTETPPLDAFRLPFDAFTIQIPPDYIPMYVVKKWPDGRVEREVSPCRLLRVSRTPRMTHKYGLVDIYRIACTDISGAMAFTERRLEEMTEGSDELPDIHYSDPFGGNIHTGEDEITFKLAEKLVRNFVAYMQAVPDQIEEVTKTKKSKKQKKRGDTRPPIRRFLARTTVPLKWEMRDAAQYTTNQGERKRLNERIVVKGHWRRQPYGPGRKQRKLVYIQPYRKGEEGAPVKSFRTYKGNL